METEKLLRPAEVAARLGITVECLYHKLRAGEIPNFKFGKSIRVKASALEKYIQESERGSEAVGA